jgi:hypothetical protein
MLIKTILPVPIPAVSPPQSFALPGILSEGTHVLVDQTARIVSLQVAERLVGSRKLSPAAMSVLLGLLQAYPRFCSYEQLFALRFGMDLERRPVEWEPEVGLPPIRYAISVLVPALHDFGMDVLAVRGQGYVLAPLVVKAKTESQSLIPVQSAEDRSRWPSGSCAARR